MRDNNKLAAEEPTQDLSSGTNVSTGINLPAETLELASGITEEVNEFGETHVVSSEPLDVTTTFDSDSDSDSIQTDATEPPTESKLAYGRYRVERVLGKGGFGAVYLAEDTQLDRRVAIKVPVISANSAEEAAKIRGQFLVEARNLAGLTHPGIVTVLDVTAEGDQCYIVSEFLDGPDLRKWLADNSVTWQQSAEIVATIADALAYAHSQSTVHRDLKPGNIILTQRAEGLRPVVVDFGLAISESPGAQSVRGSIAGTPNYMSPEQAQGAGHRIDGRTDIFALGVILYRMLCAELPFTGESVSEVLRRVVTTDPIPPRRHDRTIPKEIEAVCLKAMSKDVDERYTTAGDLASELREILRKNQAKSPAVDSDDQKTHAPKQAVRRQVTVMNCECDLFDSDDFLDTFSAEDQHTALREFMRVCRESVSEFDGTIVQSTGERFLVCFGYPTAHEDAARRAVRAGMKLIDDAESMKSSLELEHKIDFAVRIAIHTGAAVLQDADANEGSRLSMMGEARTVAMKMKDVSCAGSLVVTETTQRLVQGFFEIESQGKSPIKGAPDPLETFLVKSESEASTRLEVNEQATLSPLVGRDEEMGLLIDLWDEATDESGQIVCVIGEAGLGKSRLVREIREHVASEQNDEPSMIYEWRCSPFFQNTALYPATEHLENVLQIQIEPNPEKRLERLVDHLQDYDLTDPETVWLLASLLSIPTDDRFPPNPLSPQRQLEETLKALLRLLRQYAAKNCVLFVVEDLHWIDATTLELLGMIVDQGVDDRMLSLFTFRPEFETPWGSRAYQTQIALNRLTRAEVASMICNRVGLSEAPDEIVDRIIERTEGVPLFVEEFCNALVEANAFVTSDGQVRLSDDFNIGAIPATLKDLLISRLDRLEIRSDLVLLGATIGREFSFQMMSAITGLDDDELTNNLEQIVAAEILNREGTPPEAIYTFKHALIQDAAYDSLLSANRRQNHLNIANVLETEFPETKETTPEILAQHFTQGGETQKGIQYWLQAGQRAQGQSANNEAISHFDAGLQLVQELDDEQQRAELDMAFRFPMIASLMGARGYAAPEIEPHHIRVQEIGMKSGDPNMIGRLLLPYWQWVFINGDNKKSIETTDSLLENAEKADDDGLRTEAHWSSGCAKYFLGRFTETVEHERQALSTYDVETSIEYAKVSFQNSGPLAFAFLSKSLFAMGKIDQSIEAMDEALRRAPELPEPFSMVVVNWNAADLGNQMRDADQIMKYATPTIQACEELGFPFFLGMATSSSGIASFLRQDYETAAESIQRGIDTIIATGADIALTVYYTFLAESYWQMGQRDDAKKALDQSFARLESDERYFEAEMRRVRGEFALDEGDPTAARRSFDESLEVAARQKADSFALRTTLRIAEQLIAEGKTSEAQSIVRTAKEKIEGGAHTPDMVAAAKLLEAS